MSRSIRPQHDGWRKAQPPSRWRRSCSSSWQLCGSLSDGSRGGSRRASSRAPSRCRSRCRSGCEDTAPWRAAGCTPKRVRHSRRSRRLDASSCSPWMGPRSTTSHRPRRTGGCRTSAGCSTTVRSCTSRRCVRRSRCRYGRPWPRPSCRTRTACGRPRATSLPATVPSSTCCPITASRTHWSISGWCRSVP